jgi:uncharacterized repeat protein (TIGR01451 family)
MPDFLSMNTTFFSYLNVYSLNQMGLITNVFSDTFSQTVVCAYDPNDKLAQPNGIDSLGFIHPNTEYIDYTIRFQNTGTDTAFNINILDQLDSNLVWNSLTPLASSHNYDISLSQTGEAQFYFQNIMLPDSNVNFLGSQGYITYRMGLKPNLPLGTRIYNTASIYFDANPAIITNTEINTLYDCVSAVVNFGVLVDSTCIYLDSIDLSLIGSSPPGGSYSGIGVANGFFIPSAAGIGNHVIEYTYEDSYECSTTAIDTIVVDGCLELNEKISSGLKIYPNPTTGQVFIEVENLSAVIGIGVFDIYGKEISTSEFNSAEKLKLNLEGYLKGIYLIKVWNDGFTVTNRIIVH